MKGVFPEGGISNPMKPGDAGYDLVASKILKSSLFKVWYDTEVSLEIPEGYVGLLVPRSSLSTKGALYSALGVGIIDSSYRGNIQVRFNRTLRGFFTREKYRVGEKVGQLVIVPYISPKIEKVESLTKTERGGKGFGSTNIKKL